MRALTPSYVRPKTSDLPSSFSPSLATISSFLPRLIAQAACKGAGRAGTELGGRRAARAAAVDEREEEGGEIEGARKMGVLD